VRGTLLSIVIYQIRRYKWKSKFSKEGKNLNNKKRSIERRARYSRRKKKKKVSTY